MSVYNTPPELGTSWATAIERAYQWGYNCFSDDYNEASEKVDSLIEEGAVDSRDMGRHLVRDMMDLHQVIATSEVNRELWNSIDQFFQQHMPADVNERYQREAAVAEEIDVSFEAGALDGIFNRECEPKRVAHLGGMIPEA